MNSQQPNGIEALRLLQEGNDRFRNGLRSVESFSSHLRMQELAERGQSPFAIILTCSDSRVPTELVFDRGLGDLFVIRVAGNVVAPSLVASIEFAASRFQTPLCVVMGHSGCGAIDATLSVEQEKTQVSSPNLGALVEMIRPAVKKAIRKNPGVARDKLMPVATLENVRHSVDQLLESSQVIRDLSTSGRLLITGAIYDIRTGKVKFEGTNQLAIGDRALPLTVSPPDSEELPLENGRHPALGYK